MKEDMNSFSDEFIGKYSIEADVDTMRTEFSSKFTQLMTDYIPSKLSTARFSLPWINRNLKRLSHRKKRSYKKPRSQERTLTGKDTNS